MSKKSLTLKVTLEFDEPVVDLDEVTRNVRDALVYYRDEVAGLTPEDETAVTDVVIVEGPTGVYTS